MAWILLSNGTSEWVDGEAIEQEDGTLAVIDRGIRRHTYPIGVWFRVGNGAPPVPSVRSFPSIRRPPRPPGPHDAVPNVNDIVLIESTGVSVSPDAGERLSGVVLSRRWISQRDGTWRALVRFSVRNGQQHEEWIDGQYLRHSESARGK